METLPERMFVPQDVLEAWAERPGVEVDAESVAFRRPGIEYELRAAVLFCDLVSDDCGSKLIGKVMTEADVQAHGGELMGDSVLFGEAAFSVRPGFTATRKES